ncbi:MAG TPA: amidohydrolase family protein [Pseudonocardia sp.]
MERSELSDVLDSHVHFWDPHRLHYPWLAAEPALNRTFVPADLAAARRSEGGGVLVVEADRVPQEAVAEVDWLTGLARAGAPVRGVVAHVPLERGLACRATLAELAARPLVVGVRRLLQDQPVGFALRPDFVTGVRQLAAHRFALDLCVREHQLAEVTELARRCPEVTFVLDHLGKPAVGRTPLRDWAHAVGRLAALPNVACKLSGLTSEADGATSTPADLRSYLRHAIAVFGPARCMFGSDWPVAALTTTYDGWLATVREAVADLTAADRDRIMIRTAEAVYGLDGARGDEKENRLWC